MAESTPRAAGYSPGQAQLARSTCLYVATKLGDLVDDLVVVGGLVPSLLIEQEPDTEDFEAHVGTMDLDIGLAVALLDAGRYRELAERLRRAGFEPDTNAAGNPTRQRWRPKEARGVTIDFLIAPTRPDDRGGRLRDIEADFAAIIAPGLQLAFQDVERVALTGRTIMGEAASREVQVCGPGAFVVLKALAFDLRGENKDAYDLFYLLRNWTGGLDDAAARFGAMGEADEKRQALAILERDFLTLDAVGPRRVAEFLSGGPDDAIQADVVGFVRSLLARL